MSSRRMGCNFSPFTLRNDMSVSVYNAIRRLCGVRIIALAF